jgi:hypothetical protein
MVVSREKNRAGQRYTRVSWTDYFRFKTLWLGVTTITFRPAALGRDRLNARAFESPRQTKMDCHGTVGALSWRTQPKACCT